MAQKTIIRVGHSAYHTGINAAKACLGKAEAVRELRSRGCTRDHARSIIKLAIQHGGYTAHNTDGDYIECRDLTPEIDCYTDIARLCTRGH